MEIDEASARTTDYVIHTDDAGLRDFLLASLKHYNGVDGDLLKGSSELVLAASLMYHQQFVMAETERGPHEWKPYAQIQALGADFEKAFQEGFMERVFVPAANDNALPPIEIRRLMDQSIEVFIRRPDDHEPIMPLKGNLLMLGVRAMQGGRAYALPFFVDLMSGY